MSGTALTDLESRRHRRMIVVGLVRAAITTTVLVALYYVLPMDEPFDGSAVTRLVLCLVVFAAVSAWQIRSILRARYPGVRAIVGLAVMAPLFLLVFASTYFLLSVSGAENFNQAMTRTDALYFTVTTFATVGFGDLTATSQLGRVIVTVQMVLDLLILGFGLRAFLGAVRLGRERRAGQQGADSPA